MTKLTDFARTFAERLREQIPNLNAHPSLATSDHSSHYDLHLWIPPARTDTEPMIVETVGDQINIYFDLWCTFLGIDEDEDLDDDWEVLEDQPRTADEVITKAVSLISSILSEDVAIVLYAGDNDRCVCAGTFTVREGPQAEDEWRVCVRSWRGTHDSGWLLPWRNTK